jgi:hypothetical protein
MKPDSGLNLSQQKAIACGANLSSQNQIFLNALETGAPTQTIRNFLHNNWGLNTKEEISRTLNDLLEEPQSPAFNYVSEMRGNSTSQEWKQILEQRLIADGRDEEDSDLATGTLALVLEAENRMQNDKILNNIVITNIDAYNLSRGINLTRWAYQLKFISEEESWQYINKMAHKIFQIYRSWEELSVSYIMGRILYSESIDEFYETQLECHRELTTNPESPWLKLNWEKK